MKIGTQVTYENPHGSFPANLTQGKVYTVTDYDPNDREWPEGTTGTPFVTIEDDKGKPFSGFVYRFLPVRS